MNADTTTGNKPTGVFSRLGDMQEAEDKAHESDDDGNSSSSSVLQYAGVLKKFFKPAKPQKERPKPPGVTVRARATSSDSQPLPAAAATAPRLGSKSTASPTVPVKEKKPESASPSSIAKRLGKRPSPSEAQDSSVTSTKSKPESRFRVTIKRTLGSAKVSSTTEAPSAQMDNTGTVSVFKRLGRKTV